MLPNRGPNPKPAGFDAERFFAGVYWHQKWEVFKGVFTPGRNPVQELMAYARVPESLAGKSVLDIGAWNGGFTFECARRGASRVVGFGPEDPDETGFNRIRAALGYTDVEYVRGSVYDLNVSKVGRFDVVLFFGVLYHLRYPLLALDKIYEVCRDWLFLESFVSDHNFVVGPRGESCEMAKLDARLTKTPLWRFFQRDELYEDASNWFGPNMCGVVAGVESAGFAIERQCTWCDRGALSARRGAREFLGMNSYEKGEVVAASVGLHLDEK